MRNPLQLVPITYSPYGKMTKFARNLLRGAGSVIDLAPVRRQREPLYKPAKSANEALRSDWQKVGGDIHRAIRKYDEQAQK